MDAILDLHPNMSTPPHFQNTRPRVDNSRRATPQSDVKDLSRLRKKYSAQKNRLTYTPSSDKSTESVEGFLFQ